MSWGGGGPDPPIPPYRDDMHCLHDKQCSSRATSSVVVRLEVNIHHQCNEEQYFYSEYIWNTCRIDDIEVLIGFDEDSQERVECSPCVDDPRKNLQKIFFVLIHFDECIVFLDRQDSLGHQSIEQ